MSNQKNKNNGKVVQQNYFLLMNYENFNFKNLFEYLKKHKYVYWHIPCNREFGEKESGECDKYCNSRRGMQFNKNDNVYIFVTHLPNTKKNNTRILFKGEISSKPKKVKKNEFIDGSRLKGYWFKAIKICNIKTLSIKDMENNDVLNINKYVNLKTPQRICNCSKIEQKNVVNNILKDCNKLLKAKYTKTKVYDALEKVFGHKCFFGCKKENSSFEQRNGFYYYELHHFIQQHLGKKNQDEYKTLQKLIDEEENMIWLCSRCHRKIHHGKTSDIKNMVDKILTSDKGKRLLTGLNSIDKLPKIASHDYSKHAKEWIYATYNCDDNC